MRKLLIAVGMCLCTSAGMAQNVTVGWLPQDAGLTIGAGTAETLIDLSHPATAAGTLTTATVDWLGNSTSCSNAFKVKFLRPTGNTFTVVAERGPFPATTGRITVDLSPAVTVAAGDLIAVTQLQGVAVCGAVEIARTDSPSRMIPLDKEIASGEPQSIGWNGYALHAIASSSASVLVGIVPAVGATQGVGAFFRTAMQLTNTGPSIISGKLVYHPQGHSAADTDPSFNYLLAPGATTSFADIITQMGQSGLGSMDIVSTRGQAPAATTRVFSDNGAAGTLGFTEDVLTEDQAMHAGKSGVLSVPADLVNYRMNIGIRTLGNGAKLVVTYYDPSGTIISFSPQKVYPPNYFEQVPLSTFLGTANLVANAQMFIQVADGDAIVYASTTDNRTQDSSIKYANR